MHSGPMDSGAAVPSPVRRLLPVQGPTQCSWWFCHCDEICACLSLSLRTHKSFQHKLQHIAREINQAELRRQTRLRKLLGQHHVALLTVMHGACVCVHNCAYTCTCVSMYVLHASCFGIASSTWTVCRSARRRRLRVANAPRAQLLRQPPVPARPVSRQKRLIGF